MKSSEYWQERAKYLENRKHDLSTAALNNVNIAFDKAQAEIRKEIDVWFSRLAANNGISITEARKLLDRNELKEFHWDLETYIKYGQENAISQQWIKELENASAKFHISKFEALKMRTQQAYEKAFGNEFDAVDQLMRSVYTDSLYRGSYELAKGIGIGRSVGGIDESKLDHILKTPWTADGKNFSDRIWQRKNEMVNTLHRELTRTCIMGKTPDEAIKSLTAFVGDNVKNAKYAASRLAYTEAAYAYAEGIKESYSIAEVEEYEYLATLDDRTSEICREMDGKRFPMSEYSSGSTAPPLHPNCRSVTVPYDPDFDDEDPGERAARNENGDTVYVPGDITYKDWYRQFVESEEFRHTEHNFAKAIDTIKQIKYRGEVKFKREDILKELQTSPIGLDVIKAMRDSDIDIKIINAPRFDGVRGEQQGNQISIFVDNIRNLRVVAQTIIHEMTHYKYGIGRCQHAEAICFAMEKMHITGRNHLTQDEWEYVKKLAIDSYPELKWERGGYGNYEQFKIVKP